MTRWAARGLLGSLKRYVRQEVRKHRHRNRTLRQRRDPLLHTLMNQLLQPTLLLLVLFMYGFFMLWPIINCLPAAIYLTPAPYPFTGILLSAQVTLVAVVFPIAIALVTLMMQRSHVSSTNAHVRIYYADSFALRVGLSSLAFSMILALQLFLPFGIHTRAGSVDNDLVNSAALSALNLLWFLINILGIFHFLNVSLKFIDPQGRALIRERFTANRSIPHHVYKNLFSFFYYKAADVLSQGDHVPQANIYFGSFLQEREGNIVTRRLGRPRVLVDVWGRPLAYVLDRWLKRRLIGSVDGTMPSHCLLVFPQEPFAPVEGIIVLCRHRGKEFRPLDRWLLKRAFRFGPLRPEGPPEPRAILEELADEVMGQMERMAVIGFRDALRAMLDYHRFLLETHATIDDAGQPRSLAAFGDFFGPTHDDWLRTYHRIMERSIALMDKEDDFVRELAYVPNAFLGANLASVPASLVVGLFVLTPTALARLEDWRARRVRRSSADDLSRRRLDDGDQATFMSATRTLIAAWVRLIERIDYSFNGGTAANNEVESLGRLAPVHLSHLEWTAWMVALTLHRNDDHAAKIFVECLLRWPGAGRHELCLFSVPEESVITYDVLLPSPDQIVQLCDKIHWSTRDVFAAATANLWEDILWTLAAISIRWQVQGQVDKSLAVPVRRALCRGESIDQDAPKEWVRGSQFERLFLSMLRPKIASDHYGIRLDRCAQQLDSINEPEPFPGSPFTPRSIGNRAQLGIYFEVLLVSLADGGELHASRHRVLKILAMIREQRGSEGVERVERFVNELRDSILSQRAKHIQGILEKCEIDINFDAAGGRIATHAGTWLEAIAEGRVAERQT